MKPSFKCLYIAADHFPPFRNDVAVLFGRELVNRGHKIDWILQSDEAIDKPMLTQWCASNVWVGAASFGNSRIARVRRNFQGFVNEIKVFSLARKNDYDFIQVKDKFIGGLLGLLAAKFSKTKFIYWLSYPFPEAQVFRAKTGTAKFPVLYYCRGLFFKILLYKIIMRFSDHIFVQSEQMKMDVIEEGIPVHKLTSVPMGVTSEMFEKAKKLAATDISSKNEKIVLYLGTLLKVRRIDFVIYMFVKVLESVPDAKLYIVGDSTEPEDVVELKRLSVELGIDKNIVFTGNLSQDMALEYVRKSRVCLSPFYPTPILNSTSPTKLVEYMAMRKPVVANDHPEQRLVLTESEGGICVPYDKDAFSEAVVTLLENPNDAENMGKKGFEYVKKYRDYQFIAKKVENKYREICFSHSESG